MLVPYYANKKDLKKTYKNNDYKRIELQIFLNALTPEIVKDFEDLNGFDYAAFQTSNFLQKCKKYPPVNIGGDNFVSFKDFFISAKMLIMTGFTCKYGFWKKGELNENSSGKPFTHHGIDIILPEGTPISSFSDGIVTRSELAPGYGNCVVIESNIDGELLYFCYEHLQDLHVEKGEKVGIGDKIGTCGNTGNSNGYHLHFQIDRQTAKFHPYWSSGKADVTETLKYCIDPISFLRKEKPQNIPKITKIEKTQNEPEKDVEQDFIGTIVEQLNSTNHNSGDYINFFVNSGILKGEDGKFHLEKDLTRYQMTLIIYRLYKAGLLQINNFNSCSVKFDDISNDIRKDGEFMDALSFVVCSDILKGDDGHFLPWNKLTGEQFLAIIGRIFANLKDAKDIWYQDYLDWAVELSLVEKDWIFIGKFISRKQVFSILYKILSN